MNRKKLLNPNQLRKACAERNTGEIKILLETGANSVEISDDYLRHLTETLALDDREAITDAMPDRAFLKSHKENITQAMWKNSFGVKFILRHA